jgi:hypothetical protein
VENIWAVQEKVIKWMENKVLLVAVLGWACLVAGYNMNSVHGKGQLEIQLMLEQDTQNPDSYLVKNYTFEFDGLKQELRNYALQEGIGRVVIISPDQLNLILAPPLEIENTTGTITERDIHPISGILPIDKTIEDSETDETTHILDPANFLSIGDFEWTDVTGNITKKGNQAIVTIED